MYIRGKIASMNVSDTTDMASISENAIHAVL